MEVVGNASFPNVLITKLEYKNNKFLSNDILGETKANFTTLKDYYTWQLNFKNEELLNNFIDSLTKAEDPQRLVLAYLFYNYGKQMEMA